MSTHGEPTQKIMLYELPEGWTWMDRGAVNSNGYGMCWIVDGKLKTTASGAPVQVVEAVLARFAWKPGG